MVGQEQFQVGKMKRSGDGWMVRVVHQCECIQCYRAVLYCATFTTTEKHKEERSQREKLKFHTEGQSLSTHDTASMDYLAMLLKTDVQHTAPHVPTNALSAALEGHA